MDEAEAITENKNWHVLLHSLEINKNKIEKSPSMLSVHVHGLSTNTTRF